MAFRICSYCGRPRSELAMRICSLDNKPSCVYCCSKCEHNYKAAVGRGCKLFDKNKREKKQSEGAKTRGRKH